MRTALFLACSLPLLAGACQSTHEYWDAPGPEASDGAGETDDDAGEADAPVGAATCSEVLTCMQACADMTCVDACGLTVCPANIDEVEALMACVERDCVTQCADFSDPACTTCVTSACSTEGFACFGASC